MVKLTENIVYGRTKSATESVRRLNLWGCDIDDISLCANMPNLEILSMSVNRVKDLQALKNCKNLQELYLRKNEVDDMGQLQHLKDLPQLKILWMDENPCVESFANDSYRRKVLRILPNLGTLDNKVITPEESATAREPSPPPGSALQEDSNQQQSRRRGSSTSRQSSYERSANIASDDQHDSDNDERVMSGNEYSYISPRDAMNHSAYASAASMNGSYHGRPVSEVAFYDPIAPANMLSSSMVLDTVPEHHRHPMSPNTAEAWADFNMDHDMHAMTRSMYAGSMSARPNGSIDNPLNRTHPQRHPVWFSKSVTMPRPRGFLRSRSSSPAKLQRQENIVAAIAVLLDELDQSSLRAVIEEAQRRLKKKR